MDLPHGSKAWEAVSDAPPAVKSLTTSFAPAANAASSSYQPASPPAPPSASATPSPASTETTPPD
jgi:hypothetical protein